MNLTVTVDRMRVRAFHGLFPQERTAGNIFEVTVSITFPVDETDMASDSIGATISYADIAQVIKDEMTVPSNLLEHVALRILRRVREMTDTTSHGSVCITKVTPPIPAHMQGASVTLDW